MAVDKACGTAKVANLEEALRDERLSGRYPIKTRGEVGATTTRVLAGLAVAACLTGCAPFTSGPIRLGGDPGELCVPARAGDAVGVGDIFTVDADAEPITIESVTLTGAENLNLTDAYLVPMGGTSGVMAMTLDDPPSRWEDRVAIKDAVVEPGSAANFIALIQRQPGGDAHADGLTVTYRVGGRQYEATGTTSVVVADNCN